jgi:hypothetical protein
VIKRIRDLIRSLRGGSQNQQVPAPEEQLLPSFSPGDRVTPIWQPAREPLVVVVVEGQMVLVEDAQGMRQIMHVWELLHHQ